MTDDFVLDSPRHDQSTFSGRFLHFLNVIDPRTLFTSDKVLQEYVGLLDQYRQGNLPPGVTSDDLWRAQKAKQAILHPDTGDKIPMPVSLHSLLSKALSNYCYYLPRFVFCQKEFICNAALCSTIHTNTITLVLLVLC